MSRTPGDPDAKSFTLPGRSSSPAHRELVSAHSTDTPFGSLALDQFVDQALMIRLAMGVGDEFLNSPSTMTLTTRNQAVQTFLMIERTDRSA